MLDKMTLTAEWSDKDWNKLTKWLGSVLKSNVVTVTFTKKDGTERVMNCTLNPELLPPAPITEDRTERKQNKDTMAVYDTEAKGWRSFTIKSLKNIKLEI